MFGVKVEEQTKTIHLIKTTNYFLIFFDRDGDGDTIYCFVPGHEVMACIQVSGEFVVSFLCVFVCLLYVSLFSSCKHLLFVNLELNLKVDNVQLLVVSIMM